MPQSLSHLYIHLVFSTKDHRRFIDDSIAPQLYAYMAKVAFEVCGCSVKVIGGVEDHIYLLINLSRTETVAHLVEMIKKRSSRWMKTKGPKYRLFQWQTGYGVFSVSQSNLVAVTRYIERQKEHHRKNSFMEEYRLLLEKHGIEYDERYVWD